MGNNSYRLIDADYTAAMSAFRNYIGPNSDAEKGSVGWVSINDETQLDSIDHTTNTFTLTANGFSNGDSVYFRSTGIIPAGISALTRYYVVSVATNTFKVSATVGGSEVDITSNGTGNIYVANGYPRKLTSGGTLTVSSTSPLRQTNSFEKSTGTTNAGVGFYKTFTIDKADRGRTMFIYFEYAPTTTGYDQGSDTVPSDFMCYVVQDPTGTKTLIQPTVMKLVGATNGTNYVFQAEFTTNSSVQDYAFVIYGAKPAATSSTIQFDGFKIFPSLMVSVKPPTVQTFTSGSGTYYTPANCVYIKVRAVGGGGGGSGGGSGASGGSNGGNTTFGPITCNGGNGGGVGSGVGGTGGSASLGSGPIGYVIPGETGRGGLYDAPAPAQYTGGAGGGSALFGGGGATANGGGSVGNGLANTGGGGAGGYIQSTTAYSGTGGGGGGGVDAIITSPSSVINFVVGAGGAGGTAGTNGSAGGSGGSGVIYIEIYY